LEVFYELADRVGEAVFGHAERLGAVSQARRGRVVYQDASPVEYDGFNHNGSLFVVGSS
jgi:hypothetical protein